jgi:hypothetical protein
VLAVRSIHLHVVPLCRPSPIPNPDPSLSELAWSSFVVVAGAVKEEEKNEVVVLWVALHMRILVAVAVVLVAFRWLQGIVVGEYVQIQEVASSPSFALVVEVVEILLCSSCRVHPVVKNSSYSVHQFWTMT